MFTLVRCSKHYGKMRNIYGVFLLVGVVWQGINQATGSKQSKKLTYPCGSNIKIRCVAKYLSKNKQCKVVKTPKLNPTYELNLPIFLSKFNLTAVTTKTTLFNMRGDFEEFFIDEKLRTLVMSVNFEGIHSYAPDTIFAISQRGKEPKVFRENVNAVCPAVITAYIPIIKNEVTLQSFRLATFAAYFPNSNATIFTGPKYTKSEDPLIEASFKALVMDIPSALQEIFMTEASYYFISYIQNNICNYGLNLQNKYDTSVLASQIDVSTEDETILERPCELSEKLVDVDDVRNVFAKRASCSVVNQPTVTTMHMTLNAYLPCFNSSLYVPDAEVLGLEYGSIEDIYYNSESEMLVMAVNFGGIVTNSSQLYLYVNRRGKLPIQIAGTYKSAYPLVLTASIPTFDSNSVNTYRVTAESIAKLMVTAHIPNPHIEFELGPTFTQSEEPEIQEIVKKIEDDPLTVVQELLATEGYNYFVAYIQRYICNFGIKDTVFYDGSLHTCLEMKNN